MNFNIFDIYFLHIGLNDRDLIGIGGKYTVAEAKGEKYVFLYRVLAPSNWGDDENPEASTEAGKHYKIKLKQWIRPDN